MGIVVDFYTKKKVIGERYTEQYASELFSIAHNQYAHKCFGVYLLDSKQNKYWVYNFASEKDAITFMNRYNTEKLSYVLDESSL